MKFLKNIVFKLSLIKRYYVTKKTSKAFKKSNEKLELAIITLQSLNNQSEKQKNFSIQSSDDNCLTENSINSSNLSLKKSEKDTSSLKPSEFEVNANEISLSKSNLIQNAEEARLARMVKKEIDSIIF